MRNRLLFVALVLFVLGCQKNGNDNPQPVDPSTGKCKLVSETSDLAADPFSLTYQWGADGLLNSVLKRNLSSNEPIDTLFFSGNTVYRSDVDKDWLKYEYASPIHISTLATPATGTLTKHGTSGTEADYYEFVYTYDGQQRLTKISEKTPNFPGDYEWDILISYNSANNVTSLVFNFTTGPAIAPKVTVTGYDNHPTPYQSIPNYRFFMNKYHWNNPDVEPLITALSANNLTGYTIETGFSTTTRSFTNYQYNAKGFPTSRVSTETSGSTSTTSNHHFEYTCTD